MPEEVERPSDEERLYEVFAALESAAEAKDFLYDLCTPREVEEFVVRWKIAQLLHQGMSQTKIGEITNAAAATIVRVNRFLRRGAGGYRALLGRLYPPGRA